MWREILLCQVRLSVTGDSPRFGAASSATASTAASTTFAWERDARRRRRLRRSRTARARLAAARPATTAAPSQGADAVLVRSVPESRRPARVEPSPSWLSLSVEFSQSSRACRVGSPPLALRTPFLVRRRPILWTSWSCMKPTLGNPEFSSWSDSRTDKGPVDEF